MSFLIQVFVLNWFYPRQSNVEGERSVPGSKQHIALHPGSLLISLSFQPTVYIPRCTLAKSNLEVTALFQDPREAGLNPFALR